jgi:hypothetical protein
MLIHMTPGEVKGLQNLAMAHGGSLTINPDTGLPEAGFLGKLLPMLLGGLGMAFGIPPIWMGALGAVGGTAITGSLKQGLLAGLGAFGGASMAGGLGLGSKISSIGTALPGGTANIMHAGATGTNAAYNAANTAKTVTPAVMNIERTAVPLVAKGAQQVAAPAVMAMERGTVPLVAGGAQQVAKTGLAGIAQGFGDAAKVGLPGGIIGKAAPMIAGMGVLGGGMTPTAKPSKDKKEPDEYGYTGPYQAHRQVFNPLQEAGPFDPTNFDSSEQTYFGPTTYTDAAGKPYIPGQKTTPTAANAASAMANPIMLTPEQRMKLFGYADGGQVGPNQMMSPTQTTPQPAQQMMDGSYSMQQSQPQMQQPQMQQPQMPQQPPPPSPYMSSSGYGQPQGGIKGLPGLAAGGTLHMRSGSFVMPARETAEFGNGSSGAGQQVLARLGGTPIHGSGDGVSDSIPASINGKQRARVARDEVHFTPEAVARIGGGNHSKGTQKLYALMDKAQKARKSAKRGQDTRLRAVA